MDKHTIEQNRRQKMEDPASLRYTVASRGRKTEDRGRKADKNPKSETLNPKQIRITKIGKALNEENDGGQKTVQIYDCRFKEKEEADCQFSIFDFPKRGPKRVE